MMNRLRIDFNDKFEELDSEISAMQLQPGADTLAELTEDERNVMIKSVKKERDELKAKVEKLENTPLGKAVATASRHGEKRKELQSRLEERDAQLEEKYEEANDLRAKLESLNEEKFKAEQEKEKAVGKLAKEKEDLSERLKASLEEVAELNEDRDVLTTQLNEGVKHISYSRARSNSEAIEEMTETLKSMKRRINILEAWFAKLRYARRARLSDEMCAFPFMRKANIDSKTTTIVIPVRVEVDSHHAGAMLEGCRPWQIDIESVLKDVYQNNIKGVRQEESVDSLASHGGNDSESDASSQEDHDAEDSENVASAYMGNWEFAGLLPAEVPTGLGGGGRRISTFDDDDGDDDLQGLSAEEIRHARGWNGLPPAASMPAPATDNAQGYITVGRPALSSDTYHYQDGIFLPATGAEHAGRRSSRGLQNFSRGVQHRYNSYNG